MVPFRLAHIMPSLAQGILGPFLYPDSCGMLESLKSLEIFDALNSEDRSKTPRYGPVPQTAPGQYGILKADICLELRGYALFPVVKLVVPGWAGIRSQH